MAWTSAASEPSKPYALLELHGAWRSSNLLEMHGAEMRKEDRVARRHMAGHACFVLKEEAPRLGIEGRWEVWVFFCLPGSLFAAVMCLHNPPRRRSVNATTATMPHVSNLRTLHPTCNPRRLAQKALRKARHCLRNCPACCNVAYHVTPWGWGRAEEGRGELLLSIDVGGEARLWNALDGSCLLRKEVPFRPGRASAALPGGAYIVVSHGLSDAHGPQPEADFSDAPDSAAEFQLALVHVASLTLAGSLLPASMHSLARYFDGGSPCLTLLVSWSPSSPMSSCHCHSQGRIAVMEW